MIVHFEKEINCCNECPFKYHYIEQGFNGYVCNLIEGYASIIHDLNKIHNLCPFKK